MKTLNTLIAVAVLGLFAQPVLAGDMYTVDKSHSKVGFSVDHLMISEVEGEFHEYSAEIDLNEKKFTKTRATAIVKVASIDTDNEKRDNHLRSADFFDAEKFPEMKFEIVNITEAGKNYKADVKLTIKDVTKTIPFDLVFKGTAVDPWGNAKAGFKASAAISRSEFGIKWNKALEAGGVLVGDEVRITLNIEADKAK